MRAAAKSEVKGVWFTTARRYILERHGPLALDAVVAQMPSEHRGSLTEPLASSWYPEEALQLGLGAMSRVLGGGDPDKFVGMMEACTALGINHFFRALIRLGTPAMVVRKVPAMWRLIRRGDADIQVEADNARAVVHYARFPYFYDLNYRLLTLGSLRTILWICAQRVPRVDIVSYERDALSVSLVYGASSVAPT